MAAEPPTVCSLSATELPARLAEIAELGRAALLDARAEGTHAELRFADKAGVRERVEAIIAAESLCCAFLTMRVSDVPPDLMLTIDAPPGTENVLGDLVGAFRTQRQTTR